MKKQALVLFAALTLSVPLFAQTVWNSSKIEKYNGYDYELWNQDNKGSVSMTLTGDNGSGANAKGGTFTAQWSNTCNVLFRSGKKWGTNSTQNHTAIGQMTVDFAATWNSSDDVRYLGLYGWAYFVSGKIPTKRENGSSANFSNQIEWYIIQDRGSYNPTSGGDCKAYGNGATINGIAYDFKVCDRIGQPMLTGNGNFKQFFSIPKNTSQHRQSGVVDVSAHFNGWHNAGMYMDGPLYEVAMKIESYKCNNNQAQGSGSGSVTKNILTIGGSSPPAASSSSAAVSSSSKASSSSAAVSSSSIASSSSAAVSSSSIASSSSAAVSSSSRASSSSVAVSSSSRASSSSVAVSSPSGTSSSSEAEPSSSSDGAISPIKLIRPLSRVEFRVISFKGALQVESHAKAVVKVYNIDGNEVLKFDAPAGESIVQISLTPGIYIVKNVGTKKTQKVMVK